MTDEPRERFYKVIAERVSPERVIEVHVFPAVRQGGQESGLAVIAALAPIDADPGDTLAEAEVTAPVDGAADSAPPAGDPPAQDERGERLTVYRARYRLALKGPERGKWEADVSVEADAPLSAVDEVVRGVHLRAGEGAEPERLSGDAFRAALLSVPWTSTP